MVAMGAHAAAYNHVRPPTTTTSILICPQNNNNNNNNMHVMVVVMMVMVFSSWQVAGQKENPSEALLKFKSALANANPGLDDWVSSTSPCSGNTGNWRGVLCFNGYVWGLQLENMKLAGQIDVNSLLPLRFVRTLSFMNNTFQGTMPDWRKLGALKSLYLSNNQFSGEIPEYAFRGMTSLKKVYLANNKFTGPIPASLESPKLIELRLDNNQFTGAIPAISSDNLKVFNVSNNQLEGPIPAPLLKMDPSSFAGNKALCGKPLGASCDPPIPPPDLEPSLFPPPPPADDAPPANKSMGPSTIAIIALSIMLSLFLIVLLLLLCRRRRTTKTQQTGTEMSAPSYALKSGAAVAATTVSARAIGGEISASGRKGQQPAQQAGAGKLSFVRDDRQKFDLQDLMRASAEVLGSGNFGASYKAVLVDGEALVVKRFKQMNNIEREDFHEHMRRIGRLKHTNLLPLVAYLYRKEEKLLVFDFVSNGSLAAHLHGEHAEGQPRLNWGNRLKVIKGVSKGLAYLNAELPSLTVPHGHLKSSNVLVDNNFNALLMDYALGPVVNPNQVHRVLVGYKCPEYAQTARTSKKTDVWCLGILILETLTGKLVTKYMGQGTEQYGPDLAKWIDDIVQEAANGQAFDKQMDISSDACRAQVDKLLQIGIACCQEDLDKRLDLEDALKNIEQVQQQ